MTSNGGSSWLKPPHTGYAPDNLKSKHQGFEIHGRAGAPLPEKLRMAEKNRRIIIIIIIKNHEEKLWGLTVLILVLEYG